MNKEETRARLSETKVLQRITENLLKALQESQDIRLVPYLAEYFVAYALSVKGSEYGYNVKVLGKRRGPDLVIRNVNSNLCKAIEIKTGHTDRPGLLCSASFGMGNSIKKGEFSACVFVVFEELKAKEYLVFSLDELKEVPEKKRGMFPNNQCNLFWCEDLLEYEREFPNVEDRLDVEIRLHNHPENFRNRWDKIFS